MKKSEGMQIYKYNKEYMGDYSMPEGLREVLVGKSVEEQLKYYRYTYSLRLANITAYDKPTPEDTDGLYELDRLDILLGAVVDGDLVVGIKVQCSGSQESCLIDKAVCYYYAEENNGSGYKYAEKYLYLVSVKI